MTPPGGTGTRRTAPGGRPEAVVAAPGGNRRAGRQAAATTGVASVTRVGPDRGGPAWHGVQFTGGARVLYGFSRIPNEKRRFWGTIPTTNN